MKPADIRGLYEEIANSVSHAIGLGLAAGAVSYLIHDTLSYDDHFRFIGAVVYGVSILLMFISSTLYHGYQLQPLKHYLRVFDHITIYLMIGGTLTPFILSHARNPLGYSALTAVWILCFLGTLYKLFYFGRSEWVSVASYFVISTIGVFGVIPILSSLPFAGIAWLVGGLLVYTVGVYFYIKDTVPFYHTVWHFFVIGGVACHFIAISMYVFPTPTL